MKNQSNRRVGANSDGSGDTEFWNSMLPGEDFSVALHYSQKEMVKTPLDIAASYLQGIEDEKVQEENVLKSFAVPQGFEVEITTPLGKRVAKKGEYITTPFTFADIAAGKNKNMKLVDVQEGNTSPLDQVVNSSHEERVAIYAQVIQDYSFLKKIAPDDLAFLKDYLQKATGKTLDQCLADETIREDNLYDIIVQAAKSEVDRVDSEQARMLFDGMDSLTKKQFIDYVHSQTKWTPSEIENSIGLEISSEEINDFIHKKR